MDYLQQRYLAFYPEPKSPLAAELADRIARVYNDCGMDMIYFDGSEGMLSRYGIDAMRWAIFQRLHGGVAEASDGATTAGGSIPGSAPGIIPCGR